MFLQRKWSGLALLCILYDVAFLSPLYTYIHNRFEHKNVIVYILGDIKKIVHSIFEHDAVQCLLFVRNPDPI